MNRSISRLFNKIDGYFETLYFAYEFALQKAIFLIFSNPPPFELKKCFRDRSIGRVIARDFSATIGILVGV